MKPAFVVYNELMEIIRSLENRKIKDCCKLKIKKYRDESGLFLIQNEHLIEEAIANGALKELYVLENIENRFDFPAVFIGENVMRKISDNVSLNHYVGVCAVSQKEITGQRIVVLENVQDPGNVGTIIRSACSFGYDGLVLCGNCCDLYNEKTIQASQGAIFAVPTLRLSLDETLFWLKENGYQIICADVHNSFMMSQLEHDESYALVFGNEGQGLSETMLQASDCRVRIEMDRFESLNVAIAAGILMHHCRYKK